jgi:methyl-accepting chemotaxis protein
MEINMSHEFDTSGKTRPHYKRKIRFINKDFQFRFILKFCLLILAGTAISTGMLFFFSSGTLTSSFQDSRLVIKSTSIAILPVVLYTNLITLALITLATIVVIFIISHRLFGPLYRFEKDLEEIGQGNLKKIIRLRKHDQLTDFAAGINKMTTGMNKRVTDIETGLAEILESASQKNAPEEVVEELKCLQRKIGSNFRL